MVTARRTVGSTIVTPVTDGDLTYSPEMNCGQFVVNSPMNTTRRAVDYTRSRHRRDKIQALISGNGWMANLAHRIGLQGKLRVDQCDLLIPIASPPLRPLRIAFASDFHAGPTTHPSAIAEACRALHDLKPDVLLLGGDFVSLHAVNAAPLAQALAQIAAPFGTYGVLGNHDLWSDDVPIVRCMEDAGIQILVIQNRRLAAPFDGQCTPERTACES